MSSSCVMDGVCLFRRVVNSVRKRVFVICRCAVNRRLTLLCMMRDIHNVSCNTRQEGTLKLLLLEIVIFRSTTWFPTCVFAYNCREKYRVLMLTDIFTVCPTMNAMQVNFKNFSIILNVVGNYFFLSLYWLKFIVWSDKYYFFRFEYKFQRCSQIFIKW